MIEKITLKDFRNYEYCEIELTSGINSLLGRNGLGKTNFLEAAFILCESKPLKARKWDELVRKGKEIGEIEGTLKIGGTRYRRKVLVMENGLSPNIKGNSQKQRAVATLPDDIALIKGGPEERRKEIDTALSNLKTGYGKDHLDYTRVVRQRNEVLKRIRSGEGSIKELSYWNELLVSLGKRLVEDRISFLADMKELMEVILERMGRGGVEIKYYSSFIRAEGDKIKDLLKRMENTEIRRGQTLVGPHRDEVLLMMDGRNSRREFSQGEQKLLTLVWKIALGEMWRRKSGNVVFLMDDCLSELDDRNAELVLNELEKKEQVIITDAIARGQLLKHHVIYLEKELEIWKGRV